MFFLRNQENLKSFTSYRGLANDILRDNNLEFKLRILLSCIASLSKKDGYCYGGNEYLAQCVANKYKKVSVRTIGRWVKELEDLEIIFRKPGDSKFQRYITIRQSYIDYLKEAIATPTKVKKPIKTEENKEVKEEVKETQPIKVLENTDKKIIELKNYSLDPVKVFLRDMKPENLRYYNSIKKWLDHKLTNGHTFSNVKNVEYEFMRLISIVKNDNIDAEFLVDYNIRHGYLKLFKPDKKPKMANDELLITDNKTMDITEDNNLDISENDELVKEVIEKYFTKPIYSRDEFEEILMQIPTISDEEADRIIAEQKEKEKEAKNNPPPEPVISDNEDITNYGPRDEEIIEKFKNLIFKNFGNYIYESWFNDLIITIEDDNLVMSGNNQFVLDTIQKDYAKDITYPGGQIKLGLFTLAKKAVAYVNKMMKIGRRIDNDEITNDDINNATINVVFRLRKH